jgi:hypothetical protein
MTVAELRERLRDLPATAKVRIEGFPIEQVIHTSLGVNLYAEPYGSRTTVRDAMTHKSGLVSLLGAP